MSRSTSLLGVLSQTTAPGSLLYGEAFSDRKVFFLSDFCVSR